MRNKHYLATVGLFALIALSPYISSSPDKVLAENSSHDPTWWSKYPDGGSFYGEREVI